MLLENQTVLIKWRKNFINHYTSKGYNFTEIGDTFEVRVEDLLEGSDVKVKFICDYCDGKNQIEEKDNYKKYYNLILGRKKLNKDCCSHSSCINRKSQESRSSKPILDNLSLAEKFPHLITEWSDKNKKSPFEHTYGSGEIVWWKCLDCNSEYDMPIYVKTSGCNCPFCSGKRVNLTNCLWNTHPEVAKLLTNHSVGYEITYGSPKKFEFKCPDCEIPDKKYVQNVVRRGFQCSNCSDSISYPEKFMMSLLYQFGIDFEYQKVFEWSKNIEYENKKLSGKKIYDFFITSLDNCIIETHGEQHFNHKINPFERTLSEEKLNDQIKEVTAKNNGINQYITIDCAVSNHEYISNSIMNSKLSELLDLSKVDYLKCHEFACNSFVKLACNMWNSSETSTREIGNKLKLDRSTVRRYLFQGAVLGWCDYDPKIEGMKTIYKNLKKNQQARQIKVIQLTDNGNFIEEWNSIEEAKKHYNINNITAVCRGRQNTAGGFKWMYKEDYEKIIKNKITC